ncbi:MAG: hypothetical protein EKK29_19670 [Hyphomicrobiales bacterium]|nr:MAG: hypothetical protein EKK29_19670 [Hyphomicrobiales bacterium]
MDEPIFRALQEWARLETAHHQAKSAAENGAARAREALSLKEAEILAMLARTRCDAIAQVRFCATLLERSFGETGALAAGVMQNAANVLDWAET